MLIWLSSISLAMFQATAELETKVDTVGNVLIGIMDTKYESNYWVLLDIIMQFEDKVAGNERNERILDRLIDIVKEKMELTAQQALSSWMWLPLTHVAIWQTIRWVSFDGNETGERTLTLDEWLTLLHAEFYWLADPAPDNFYEWRIVRKSPLSVISTWPITMNNGKRINDRNSSEDLSDHTHYVLTLEPNDNDPKPEEHIFEGDL